MAIPSISIEYRGTIPDATNYGDAMGVSGAAPEESLVLCRRPLPLASATKRLKRIAAGLPSRLMDEE